MVDADDNQRGGGGLLATTCVLISRRRTPHIKCLRYRCWCCLFGSDTVGLLCDVSVRQPENLHTQFVAGLCGCAYCAAVYTSPAGRQRPTYAAVFCTELDRSGPVGLKDTEFVGTECIHMYILYYICCVECTRVVWSLCSFYSTVTWYMSKCVPKRLVGPHI